MCGQGCWKARPIHKDIVDIPGFECFRGECKKGKNAHKNSRGVFMLYKRQTSDGVTRTPSSNKHFIWMKLNSDFLAWRKTYLSVASTFHLQTQNNLKTKILTNLIN